MNELSAPKAGWELGAGVIVGLVVFSLIIGILWALGVYHALGWNSWLVLVPALAANLPSGFLQELFFRGVIFRIANERLGVWLALLISALLFGVIHLFTAHPTLVSTLSIAAEAGLLLGAAYLLTGRLWLAIGLHTAWDVANDGIFGVGASALSGTPVQGLLQGSLTGPAILSGGQNGVEASLITVLVIGAAWILMLRKAQQKKALVR